MSRTHLLIERAFVYESNRESEEPTDSYYDGVLGAWVSKSEAGFLVKSSNPDRHFPRTKKQDQETGEDQKGA